MGREDPADREDLLPRAAAVPAVLEDSAVSAEAATRVAVSVAVASAEVEAAADDALTD